MREVEGWLLGDAAGLCTFLALKKQFDIQSPESLTDPKQELLRLAVDCSSREMREALVWRDDRSGRLYQGPDYNGILARFVSSKWNVVRSRRRCNSLERLFVALERLEADFH